MMQIPQDLNNMSLSEIISEIEKKYEVEVEPLKIDGKEVKLLQIKNLEEYVTSQLENQSSKEQESVEGEIFYHLMNLPWWAKVWEPSFVLAYFMGKQPVIDSQRILEIGAGLGVVGVYAAMCGHNVTITDVDDDALLFCKANALLNGCYHVPVLKMDWRLPYYGKPFDIIIGSEVVYDRRTYDILVNFLDDTLSTGGTIFLAKNKDLKTPLFFAKLVERFKFKEKVVKLSGPEAVIEVALYAIKRKGEV